MANTGIYDSDFEERRSISDSDEESLLDVGSPADGYFSPRDHPEETFVERSEVQAEAEAKAKEARQERESSDTTGRQPPSPTHRSPVSPTPEVPPVLDAGPAPPDYEAATAGRREQAFGNDHPLVRNGLFGEQGSLAGRVAPESMQDPPSQPTQTRNLGLRGGGGQSEHVDEETGLLSGQSGYIRPAPRRSRRRKWYRQVCVFLGIFALIIILLGVLFDPNESDHNNHHTHPPNKKLPSDDPSEDIPAHPISAECPFTSASELIILDYPSPTNFSFWELIDAVDVYRHGLLSSTNISGRIKVYPAPEEQEADVRVWLSIATTKQLEVQEVRYIKQPQWLQLMAPEIVQSVSGSGEDEKACMDIAVGIQVRRGAKIEAFETKTANLAVVLDGELYHQDTVTEGKRSQDTTLEILDETSIWAARGKVKSSYWSSRKTYIDTLSGRIEGEFALRDLLSITSKSGSINVDVDPKKVDKDHPAPAEFVANTFSGSIAVSFPDSSAGIPERDYRTRVGTNSASIAGNYLLGNFSSFTTASGSIDVDVLPYSSNLSSSNLKTDTLSGRTNLNFLSPYTLDGIYSESKHHKGVIDHLSSQHTTTTGSLSLKYPDEWEGKIDAESNAGSIKVRGKDVEVDVDVDLPTMRKVMARKGIGKSEVELRTLSGSIDLLAGRR